MDGITSLVSVSDLMLHLLDPAWVLIDCRFSLAEPHLGRREYEKAHIPGAIYAHLDDDLSGQIEPGRTGRHPLPPVEEFCKRLGRWGIGPGIQVVAYDGSGGAIAARLWWMLQWLGHEAVAVLDGGWQAWLEHEGFVKPSHKTIPPRKFVPRIKPHALVTLQEVEQLVITFQGLIVDSRSAERYQGRNETIDPVAGHIPGAISLPYQDNLRSDGTFHSKGQLRARFEPYFRDRPVDEAIFYCGSGVTAAHNLIALAHAGLGHARLYAGSWSEWITDPSRPVAPRLSSV